MLQLIAIIPKICNFFDNFFDKNVLCIFKKLKNDNRKRNFVNFSHSDFFRRELDLVTKLIIFLRVNSSDSF